LTTTLRDLNALPAHAAGPLFAACCGAPGWVSTMVARRPFVSLDAMLRVADEAYARLSDDQWLAAFAHHPRIGEQRAAATVSDAAQRWSEGEQRAASAGDPQRLYELRFGYIFIICASGRSAPQILDALRSRLRNDPDTELRVAADEQRKITRLRLEKLVGSHEEEAHDDVRR
jgi:OHCU decarboxylase